MSAAEGESIATFNAALAWMGEKNNKEVSKMIDDMKRGFKKVALDGSITDLKAKKGFAATMTDKNPYSTANNAIRSSSSFNEGYVSLSATNATTVTVNTCTKSGCATADKMTATISVE